jgi:hypothetical protein
MAGSSLESYSFDVDHEPDLAFFELGHVGLELKLKVRIIRAKEMARILCRGQDDGTADEGPSVLAGNVELECFDRGLQSCPYQLGRNDRVEEVAGLQFHGGHVLLRHSRDLGGGDVPYCNRTVRFFLSRRWTGGQTDPRQWGHPRSPGSVARPGAIAIECMYDALLLRGTSELHLRVVAAPQRW